MSAVVYHDRAQRYALLAGAAGLLLLLVAAFFARASAFQAYWCGWIFWSGLSFGSLALLLLRFLARGAWGDAIQRPAEAGAMTLPVVLLLLVPAFFGLHDLFPWTRPETFAGHDWPHKRAFLQPVWFIVRSVACFALLCPLAWLVRRWASQPDAPQRVGSGLRGLSGVGAVAYFVLMVFASTDWVMSLQPEWYSTMFVVIFAATQFLSALALAIVLAGSIGSWWLAESPTTKQLHDLGNLLLAFVIFWAYVTFSQFMLIWMGNLPREISWYLHRRSSGWITLTILLATFQFAMPFALLLLRVMKRHRNLLAPLAAIVLLATVLNMYWLVEPAWHPEGPHFPWLEVVAFIGIGGIWSATFLALLNPTGKEARGV
jgi:hypothetical protein